MRLVTEKVPIFDNRKKQYVDATLLENVDLVRIAKTSLDWINERTRIKETRLSAGLSFPEHSHWNWEIKGKQAEVFSSFQTLFAIEYGGEIEGLMIVDFAMFLAKLPPDKEKPILYIHYIETAPHNVYGEPCHFLGIGSTLYRIAVQYSHYKNCECRVGLHALPQAEKFYQERCNMTPMDKDPGHENLRYFESTQEQSRQFLSMPKY